MIVDDMAWSLLRKNALYTNSIIFVVGSVVAGFAGYLYQLFMGRLLSLEDFGTLATLTNFFSVMFVPATALITVTTQVVAGLKGQGRWGAIHDFVKRLVRFFAVVGFLLFGIFILIDPLVERWLNIESHGAFLLFSASALFIFVVALFRGILPALGRFQALSIGYIIEGFLKCSVAVALVSLSFGLEGAVLGPVFASGIIFGIVYWQIRDVFKHPRDSFTVDHIPSLFAIIFVWSLAITALSSIDVILVKRFLSAEETGLYAGMSMLGKIILSISGSVAGVMFPMATELFESGNHAEHRRLLIKALSAVVVIAGGGLLLYAFFPNLIVATLFGRKFLPASHLLIYFGTIATLIGVIQIFATYFLSLKKKWFILLLIIASVLEAVLITLFHSSMRMILLEIISVFGVLVASLISLFVFDAKPVDAPYVSRV